MAQKTEIRGVGVGTPDVSTRVVFGSAHAEQDFQPKLSCFIRSEAVKAAGGIQSNFCAPWIRHGWVNVLFEMVYGEGVDREKLQEAVCSTFFGFKGEHM